MRISRPHASIRITKISAMTEGLNKFIHSLTTSGYVQIEKEAVLALVGQKDDHLLELLIPALRHLQERGSAIGEVRIILRAHRAESVRQLDAAPRYRRDRGSKP